MTRILSSGLGFFLLLGPLATGALADTGGAVDDLLQEMGGQGNRSDLALIKNSTLGELRYWNSTNDTVSALLRVPDSGRYRIWLRHVADAVRPYPVELAITGADTLRHSFGKFILTGESSKSQEQALPFCFEDEAIRTTYPAGLCQVWEYWDVELKKGDSLFELSPVQKEAPCSQLFISASKTFIPRLPRDQYNVLVPRDQYQYSTLSRVFYRFRVKAAEARTCRFTQASLKYHWKFDPLNDTFGEGIWGVGLAQESLASRRVILPVSVSGKPDIPCGEWTDWLDATWSSQGAGPWGTGVLGFSGVKKGTCEIELAWSADPAAVVKTITADIEDGIAKFCVPLIQKGRGKIVFPDPANQTGVWGVLGTNYLGLFKSIDGFDQQYRAWIQGARAKLGLTGETRLPAGIRFITRALGGRTEQRTLGKTLVSMGLNGFNEMAPEISREIGVDPLVTAAFSCHTSDPADPARPLLVRQGLEALLKQNEPAIPDYARLLSIIVVGDEIGNIASTAKINQSAECRKRFRAYLAQVLKEKHETPSYFGVESLDDLEGLEALPPHPGLFERRLFSHTVKFRQVLSADYYRTITEAAKTIFPNAVTYANYSPAPLRQGEQVHDLGWFTLPRAGALTLAWGEDWCYRICSFTGYEIVSYYAAMVECAARKTACASGFYNVPCCLRSDHNIVSILSRNIKNVYLFSFGPAYNDTSAEEGSWSEIEAVYPEIIKAAHVAGFMGPALGAGKIEERRVALLYNRDNEIMNGGSHGEQSDRALTFAALGNGHRNADLILNEDLVPEQLARYSVLFINGFCLPKVAVPVIRSWVEKGGLLIASACSATKDEYNSPLPEMEEVFGARAFNQSQSAGYIEPLTLFRHKPIGTITIRETDFTPALTAPVIGMRASLQPTTGQSVAAFEDGTCAATVNKIGQGAVLLWGIQPGILYKGQREGAAHYAEEMSRYVDDRLALFEKPLAKVLGASPLSCDAPQVELTRFEGTDQTAVLANNFKRYAWTPDLPPMTVTINVKGDRKITSVSSALAGERPWKREGDWVSFSTPVPSTVDSFVLK